MERRLYTDSFERSLREKANEFRMYPTKKVWHSIYNNIYPGRRFPSAIVAILLMAALHLIGYLNNTKIDIQAPIVKNISFNSTLLSQNSQLITDKKISAHLSAGNKYNILDGVLSPIHLSPKRLATDVILTDGFLIKQTVSNYEYPFAIKNKSGISLIGLVNDNNNSVQSDEITESVKRHAGAFKQDKDAETVKNIFSEKSGLLEDYSAITKEPATKFANKLALQVYASPSVIYGVNSSVSPEFAGNNNATQNYSVGMEAGTSMQYALSDIIKVKAGLQFNYSNYSLEAFPPDHAISNPVLNDIGSGIPQDALSRSSADANNGISPVTFYNETYQLSLPVGFELKLMKSNKLQWKAGATIQPTYIAGGSAYMLSGDTHNIIDESSILNRWNMNAGFETFVTYRINGMTWQLGPQFRYQFASTYGKGYSTVDERLANFGVKIGVSKVIR